MLFISAAVTDYKYILYIVSCYSDISFCLRIFCHSNKTPILCLYVYISVHAVTLQSTVATSTSTETCRPDSGLGEDQRQEEKARRNFQPISWELKRRYAMHYLNLFVCVKIGYQYSACVCVDTMHTKWELCSLMSIELQ